MTQPRPFVQDALNYSIARVRSNLQTLTDFPELTRDGQWTLVPGGGWVGGHWTGLIWLAYAHTHDPALLAAARAWTERLAPRQYDLGTHDLGFLFELSYILGNKLTNDEALKAPAVQAARSLIQRFNGKGGFIQAWHAINDTPEWRGRAIIDTLMNLYLLYLGQPGDRRSELSRASPPPTPIRPSNIRCATTGRPRTAWNSIPTRANFSRRIPTRVFHPLLAGAAARPGQCTVTPKATAGRTTRLT